VSVSSPGLTSIPIHVNYATDDAFISFILQKTSLQAVVCENESVKHFSGCNIPCLIVIANEDEIEQRNEELNSNEKKHSDGRKVNEFEMFGEVYL
jgi:hypothetical protein